MKIKDEREWLKQAEYDIGVADLLYRGGKYIYAIFMCHLAIEKALKAVYRKTLEKEPPKIHNLMFFIEECGLRPDPEMYAFLHDLGSASIPTRYPEDLSRMSVIYNKKKTNEIMAKSKGVLKWVKRNL